MTIEEITDVIEPEDTIVVVDNTQKDEPVADSDEDTDKKSDDEEENEDDDSETSEEENEDDDSEKVKPKKNGFKKRIASKNKKISNLELENQLLKRQLLEGKKPSDEPEKDTKPDIEGKPNPDNFDSQDEYMEALTDWKVDQKLSAHTKKQAEKEAINAQKSHQSKINKQIEEFSVEHDDFEDVVENAEDITLEDPKLMNEAIFSSNNPPALIYALAKNPKEAQEIGKLSGLALIKAIGIFEDKHASSSTKKKVTTKKRTTAPDPIGKTVKGGAKANKDINNPNLSQAEYEQIRREQRKQKGY